MMSKKTAFTGGLLIDGTGREAVKDSLVLIDGKRSSTPARKKNSVPAARFGILPAKPLCRA